MLLKRQCIAALAVAVALGAVASGPAMAAPATKPTATFGIFPGTSTPGGISPSHMGSDSFDKYSYTITNGGALSDAIPFLVCLDAKTAGFDSSGNPVPWTDQVAVDNISGAFSADVSVATSPWSFSSSDSVIASNPPSTTDPACQSATINIAIHAGDLTGNVGDGFTTVVHFKTQNQDPSSGSTQLQDSIETIKEIHIFVAIGGGSTLTCYLTDSSGMFLIKDDGTPANGLDDAPTLANASGETDGTYTIVQNAKGKDVATNPGQFYYNLLWTNTGGDTTVNVSLTPTNLVPNGNQALHWLTDDLTIADFDEVIEGNPAGAGSATGATINNIPVPGGATLYVTWHLEWKFLGSNVSPNVNTPITVAGTVTPSSGAAVGPCTAGAVVK